MTAFCSSRCAMLISVKNFFAMQCYLVTYYRTAEICAKGNYELVGAGVLDVSDDFVAGAVDDSDSRLLAKIVVHRDAALVRERLLVVTVVLVLCALRQLVGVSQAR